MKIYRSLEETPADFGPSVLTIGNFDGVHLGHRRILRRVRQVADGRGWKPSVLTFDPHPTRVVAPERSPRLMTSPERRAELMAEEGVEQALILPVTPELSQLSPEDFVRRIVVDRLGARAVLVGDNFRFGAAAYLTDHSEIPPATMEMLRGLDVLFLDALRYKPHPTHTTVERAVQIAGELKARRTFLTHICHDLGHARAESLLPPEVRLAYDGLELRVE